MKSFRTFLAESDTFSLLREGSGFWYLGVNPTVDLVVFSSQLPETRVLLIQRSGAVEAGKWALPGGFIDTPVRKGEAWREGTETPQDAALRELQEETGVNLHHLRSHLRPIGVYERQGRDPRDSDVAWSRSYAFGVILPETMTVPRTHAQDDAAAAQWVSLRRLPTLAFDHAQILRDAIRILRPR